MAHRLSNLFFPANIAASHVWPASCSASDIAQYTLHVVLSMCFPTYAIPAACDNPEPKGPDVVSTPGSRVRSGCPCRRDPNFRNVSNSCIGKYPACAIAAYRTGQICPLERIKRSRSSQSGRLGSCFNTLKYKAVKTSAMPKGPAEWPDPAFTSILIISWRISFAFFSKSFIEYSFIQLLLIVPSLPAT